MSVDYPLLESYDFTPFQTQHNHFARRSYSLSDLHGPTLSSLISQRVPLLPWPLNGFASQANAIPKIDFSNYQFDGYLPHPSFHLLTDQQTPLFRYPIQQASAFSKAELLGLFDKATQFLGDGMQTFTCFYRDKPKAYWMDASKHVGTIMKTYRKDFNGHAGSPINGRINGLFFSCRTQPDGSLPESSVFGDIRLILRAGQVPLDPLNTRLYFADFYCNSSAKGQFGCGIHYVTIVVTRPFTEVDEFCKHNLLQLDPSNNCFLQIQRSHSKHYGWQYFVNSNPYVWIEVFLTQDVDTRFAYFRDVRSTGQSQPNGVSNNRFCSACNLLPQEPSLKEAQFIAAGGRVHNGIIEPHRRASGKRKAKAEDPKVHKKKRKIGRSQTLEAMRHFQSSVSREPIEKTETLPSSAAESFAGLRGTMPTARRGRANFKRIKCSFIQLLRQGKQKLRRGLAGIYSSDEARRSN